MRREQLSWWEPRSPTTPRVEGSGRTVLACPTPSRKRPPTNPAPEPATAGNLIQNGPTSLAPPLAPGGLLACHGVHRPPVPRAGQTARPGNRKGQHAAVRTGLAGAGQPSGEKPPLPAPPEPTTPGGGGAVRGGLAPGGRGSGRALVGYQP